MLNNIVAFAPASKASYKTTILNDSPIGFWLFDETSGSTAADSTANANSMTIRNSPTLNVSTGLTGITKAFTFNGTTQVCDTAYLSTFNVPPANNWSYEMWVKTNATASYASPGVWKGDSDQETCAFYLNVAASGRVGARFMNSTNDGLILIETTTGTFNDNNWHYLAATSTSGGAARLYVDGTEVASSSAARSTFSANRQITAGANGTGDTTFANYLSGSVCGVAVYNTTLSASQITSHYNAGL